MGTRDILPHMGPYRLLHGELDVLEDDRGHVEVPEVPHDLL